jgi:hypothetical protein
MKAVFRLTLIICLALTGCEKENIDLLVGKWKLVKGYNLMVGGDYNIDIQNQRMEEYTKDDIRIRYDFEGSESSRCNYSATNSTVTVSVEKLNGDTWSSDYDYWFAHDTLVIRNDGGFEYYDEFFVQIE